MIYLIDIFNVKFYIKVNNEEEQRIMEQWWEWFVADDQRARVSTILVFLKKAGLEFQYEWNWCRRLSLVENLRAFLGFKLMIYGFAKNDKKTLKYT